MVERMFIWCECSNELDVSELADVQSTYRGLHGDGAIARADSLLLSLLKIRKYRTIIRMLSDLLSNGNGRKMFSIVSRTWNPVTGCGHLCSYCWARRLAETKLKNTKRYREGFLKPKLNVEEFRKTFREGEFVFVCDMGDLFWKEVPDEWILRVLDHIRKFPRTYFLLLTKNPGRYHDFLDKFPPNVILGTTIETNRDDLYKAHNISRAPLPSERYRAMKDIEWPLKFVSIEPILDFDLEVFAKWILDIDPIMVYIGYDNYNNKLPEPPLKKTLQLIDTLSNEVLTIRKTIRPAWYESKLFNVSR